MNQTGGLKDLLIALHEIGGGKTFGRFLHLRVAESDPDLVDFIGREEGSNELDICP